MPSGHGLYLPLRGGGNRWHWVRAAGSTVRASASQAVRQTVGRLYELAALIKVEGRNTGTSGAGTRYSSHLLAQVVAVLAVLAGQEDDVNSCPRTGHGCRRDARQHPDPAPALTAVSGCPMPHCIRQTTQPDAHPGMPGHGGRSHEGRDRGAPPSTPHPGPGVATTIQGNTPSSICAMQPWCGPICVIIELKRLSLKPPRPACREHVPAPDTRP